MYESSDIELEPLFSDEILKDLPITNLPIPRDTIDLSRVEIIITVHKKTGAKKPYSDVSYLPFGPTGKIRKIIIKWKNIIFQKIHVEVTGNDDPVKFNLSHSDDKNAVKLNELDFHHPNRLVDEYRELVFFLHPITKDNNGSSHSIHIVFQYDNDKEFTCIMEGIKPTHHKKESILKEPKTSQCYAFSTLVNPPFCLTELPCFSS